VKTSLVLTLIGPDRPGLVGSISQLVAAHGGNWEESRMAHLAGQFAGILLVELPSERADALIAGLAALETAGLRVVAEPSEPAAGDAPGVALKLEVVGQDREGIVRDISQVLASRSVNVEELSTACEAAPLAGGTLFRAKARLQAPESTSVDDLRVALEALSDDLVVDLAVERARGATD
jgi:glycine cleavage system regulatory protein